MHVIGVLDLRGGRAVHARDGRRESYEPVRTIASSSIDPGDAVALARAYVNDLGVDELYAADLDAILSRLRAQPFAHNPGAGCDEGGAACASHDALIAAVAALGVPLWLDAGTTSVGCARHALALGATRLVVGLETLPSYDSLADICTDVGGERVAFSLDLRNGVPVVAADATQARGITSGEPAEMLAARAAGAGARAMIVIDLARVGTGRGLDLDLIARVRENIPGLTLAAGGGVRGLDDLARLADVGCDAALAASALHDGRLSASDVAAAKGFR